MRELDEHDWAREQTCTALQNNADVNIAKLFSAVHHLPMHNDRWKNWDNFLAVHHAKRLCAQDEHILDAGACRDPGSPSVFLPGLKTLGFDLLHGCNLDEPGDGIEGTMVDDIYYTHQNIEGTKYPKDYFGFAACLSTIEHGVDWRKYFSEMARVIRPGGYLFTSFDYWANGIDTSGKTAFDVPVTIFNQHDVMSMYVYAKGLGLSALKAPDLAVKEAPVEWLGMKYTFMNMLMRKEA